MWPGVVGSRCGMTRLGTQPAQPISSESSPRSLPEAMRNPGPSHGFSPLLAGQSLMTANMGQGDRTLRKAGTWELCPCGPGGLGHAASPPWASVPAPCNGSQSAVAAGHGEDSVGWCLKALGHAGRHGAAVTSGDIGHPSAQAVSIVSSVLRVACLGGHPGERKIGECRSSHHGYSPPAGNAALLCRGEVRS